jgi:hypothetical protein
MHALILAALFATQPAADAIRVRLDKITLKGADASMGNSPWSWLNHSTIQATHEVQLLLRRGSLAGCSSLRESRCF